MSNSIKGFPTDKKTLGSISGYTAEESEAKQQYVTVAPTGSGKHALDVMPKAMFNVNGPLSDVTVGVGNTTRIIVAAAHGARAGDVIRFTSGANERVEATVLSTPDANTIILATELESAPVDSTDTFRLMRHITLTIDQDGALSTSSGPVQFVLDGGSQVVTEDTVTPANNRPLPVKLTDFAGDVSINPGNLNLEVQLSHSAAIPDSVQIGDGTEILLVNADGSISIGDGTESLAINPTGSILIGDGTTDLGINATGSIIIGDGTNDISVNGSNELLVNVNGAIADNAADSGNPVKVGGRYNAVAPTYGDGDRADLQVDVNGRLLVSDITVGSTPGSFAEDSVAGDGDDGTHVLAVRRDTRASNVSADGDYASIQQNAVGELYVKDTDAEAAINNHSAKFTTHDLDSTGTTEDNIGVNLRRTGAGGSVELLGQQAMADSLPVAIASDQSDLSVVGNVADNAADSGNPVKAAGVYNSVAPTLDDGDRGNLQLDVNGRLLVSTGASGALASEYAEDSAHSDADVGQHLLAVRQDTLASSTSADGDYASIKSNDVGQVYVKEPNIPDIGQQASAGSMSVVLASDSSALPVAPSGSAIANAPVRNDHSSVNITTGAWVQLVASTAAATSEISIFDSSGETLELGVGPAASEVTQINIFPGGNGREKLLIPAGSRVAVRAVSANATVGELNINFFQ